MEQGVTRPRMQPPPQTARLILREFVDEDEEGLLDGLGDPETNRFMPHPLSRLEVKEWIARNQRRYDLRGHGLWAVVLRQSGEFLGDCGPVWQELNGESHVEIGYHFRRGHWGHGYATEAARAATGWAFENLGVDHVISLIRPENHPSRRVAERNGFALTGRAVWRSFEHCIYRMEAKDFPQKEPAEVGQGIL